uniref:Uncharacterized protein n=1 Tax=Triticum urartu TaxID=4572 RepID=A0A8R7UH14_TRIUA
MHPHSLRSCLHGGNLSLHNSLFPQVNNCSMVAVRPN